MKEEQKNQSNNNSNKAAANKSTQASGSSQSNATNKQSMNNSKSESSANKSVNTNKSNNANKHEKKKKAYRVRFTLFDINEYSRYQLAYIAFFVSIISIIAGCWVIGSKDEFQFGLLAVILACISIGFALYCAILAKKFYLLLRITILIALIAIILSFVFWPWIINTVFDNNTTNDSTTASIIRLFYFLCR